MLGNTTLVLTAYNMNMYAKILDFNHFLPDLTLDMKIDI